MLKGDSAGLGQSSSGCLHSGRLECHNCGATDGLKRCSRCKNAWFCSLACHKDYWPVHKSMCKINDFATALEAKEPKFAAWMREHGKLAVIKDREVERLERAAHAVCGTSSREAVMDSMYGKADPAPQAPTYTAEEWLAMQQRQSLEKQQMLLLTPQERCWHALPPIQPGFGMECTLYRWSQDLSHVMIHIKLPGHIPAAQVRVVITSAELVVQFQDDVYIQGQLYKEVDVTGCTWFVDTGVLHIQLLKRCRRNRYNATSGVPSRNGALSLPPTTCVMHDAPGQGDTKEIARTESLRSSPSSLGVDKSKLNTLDISKAQAKPATAADTYWRAIFCNASKEEWLSTEAPPTAYYFAEFDRDECH